MEAKKIEVLVIRKGQTGCSPLSSRLASRGCKCHFATSSQQVAATLASQDCDLILGPIRLDGDSLYPLIAQLDGGRATLFYYLPVEDGCWWLPAVWSGVNRFGAPAIPNREFVTVLDDTLDAIRDAIRLKARAAAEPFSSLDARPLDSSIVFPFPRKMNLPAPPVRAQHPNTAVQKLG